MCFDVLRNIISDISAIILLLGSLLLNLLALPGAFWRTLYEWNQSIRGGIRYFLMPRLNANGDIYNPPAINRSHNESGRRRRRLVNGTGNETAGDRSPFVVTHYDDDDSHDSEQTVDETLVADVDELIAAEQQRAAERQREERGQRAEQGPQEQGPHQPRPQHQQLGQQQSGQQQSGQQQPESHGHELQQLEPQQQSSELPPREPMPRERVAPQQGSEEPAPMPGRGQPGETYRRTITFTFGPNGIQPRAPTIRRTRWSNPASPANQQAQPTQGRDSNMPDIFPAESDDRGKEH
ncbi:hypothetical protein BDV30DRAFT_239087 [Aspergillus minisclerotigenes]|uniref:Uncharacterized protein n=1 Tax=Aspergillus minisclerotigenes TaxID=656917 RepID=A0A5N6J5M7_9EURO|nr:hypothetical protein BDV30DRAFT_239087 [Aspergillus minisclerotigenes]